MKKQPAWWPTLDAKQHADAGCAHPDECNVPHEHRPDESNYGRCVTCGSNQQVRGDEK